MAAVLPPPAPPTTDLALHSSPASPQLAFLSSPDHPPLKRTNSSTSSTTTTTTGKGDGVDDPGLDEPLDNSIQEEHRAKAYAGAPLVELSASLGESGTDLGSESSTPELSASSSANSLSGADSTARTLCTL